METKFYACGDGAVVSYGSTCDLSELKSLTAKSAEDGREKHLPVIDVNGDRVTVTAGSVEHPSTQEHFIGLIVLETEKGIQAKRILPEERPSACFTLCDDRPVAAYAFCNLHGLWKAQA